MPKAPTQEQIAYMMAHIDDNLVPNIIIATSVCGAVATGFLFLRFYARRVAEAALQMSDWLLAVGWVCCTLTKSNTQLTGTCCQDILPCF